MLITKAITLGCSELYHPSSARLPSASTDEHLGRGNHHRRERRRRGFLRHRRHLRRHRPHPTERTSDGGVPESREKFPTDERGA